MNQKCPPTELPGARRELARRIAEIRAELVERSLQALSIERPSASISLTAAAHNLSSAVLVLSREDAS